MKNLAKAIRHESTGVRHQLIQQYDIESNEDCSALATIEYNVFLKLGVNFRVPECDANGGSGIGIFNMAVENAKLSLLHHIYEPFLSQVPHLMAAVYDDRSKLIGMIQDIEDACLGKGKP